MHELDTRMKIKRVYSQMSGTAKNPQIAALQSALEQLAKGSPAPLSLGGTLPPSSGAIQAMFSSDPQSNFTYPEAYPAPRGTAPYGYFGTHGLGQGQNQGHNPGQGLSQNHTRAKGGVFMRIVKVALMVVIVLVILGRFSIGPLAGKLEFLEGTFGSSHRGEGTMFRASQRYAAPVSDANGSSSSGPSIPFVASAAAVAPPRVAADYASTGGVVLPTHLPPTAQREDLVRYAREQAAYYAAQGVPQQEALAYISQQLQGAMSAQATRTLSNGDGDGESFQEMGAELVGSASTTAIAESASVGTSASTSGSKQPILPPQLPLVMPLTGIVPLSLPRARESTGLLAKPTASAEDEGQVDDRKMARKHKVSSESKEVQDYMKRRQQALGAEEGGDVVDDTARARDESKDVARNMGSSGTFLDPQETLL